MPAKKRVTAKAVEPEPEVSEESSEEEEGFSGESGDEELESEEDLEDDEEDEEEDDDDDDKDQDDDEDEEDEEEAGDEEADQKNGSAAPIRKEDVVDDLVYDIYNLTACNYHPVRFIDGKNPESVLKSATHRATKLLLQKLSDCPLEQSEQGPLLVLPKEIFRMPRAYKLPEKKPETKWEAFAKVKGIKKKKRERMVFDELSEEFKPRFGYKRANNGIEDYPIVEVKEGQDIYKDPWAEEKKQKQDRVKRNEKRQMQNIRRANFGKKGSGLSSSSAGGSSEYSADTVPGIPVDLDRAKAGKRGKGGVKSALQLAQISTASMGRFDEKRKGEPTIKLKGKKRSFRDNLGDGESDKKLMKDQMRFVEDKADKKARGVTNSLAAYEGILPDAPTDSFRQKKGRGKAAPSSRAKGGADRKTGSGRVIGNKGKGKNRRK